MVPRRSNYLGVDSTAQAAGVSMGSLCNLHLRIASGGRAVHVSQSVLESALRFVDDLADTDDPADLGRRALPGLDRLIPSDVLSYNEFGPEPGQVAYCAYPEDVVFGPDIMAGFEAHVHENPLIDHLAATGDGSPLMISDFLSLERFHR